MYLLLKICLLIDLCLYSPLYLNVIYLQVGITIMYMMVESKIVDPLEVGGHVLAGYLILMDLTDDEFDALKMCVAGRFAQVRFPPSVCLPMQSCLKPVDFFFCCIPLIDRGNFSSRRVTS